MKRTVKKSKGKKKIKKLTCQQKQEIVEIFSDAYKPNQIKFRNLQQQILIRFLQTSSNQPHQCLLFSGSTGTGKSFLVNSTLKAQSKKIQIIKQNSLQYQNLNQFLLKLSQHFDIKISKDSMATWIQIKQEIKKNKDKKIIMVIQQFDNLIKISKSCPQFIEQLVDLSCNGNMFLIAITNLKTLHFNSKLFDKIYNVVFQPYKESQIKELINNRIQAYNKLKRKNNYYITFTDQSLKYISQKIFNKHGSDLRIIFDICKTCILNALSSNSQIKIQLEDVCNVFEEMLIQSNCQKNLRGLPINHKIIILVLKKEKEKSNQLDYGQFQILEKVNNVRKNLHMQQMLYKQLQQCMEILQIYNMLMIRKRKILGKFQKRVSLTISKQDIQQTLANDTLLKLIL